MLLNGIRNYLAARHLCTIIMHGVVITLYYGSIKVLTISLL